MLRIIDSGSKELDTFLDKLIKRNSFDLSQDVQTVSQIISDVKAMGDEALQKYTQKFDDVILDCSDIKVKDEEVKQAYKIIDPKLLESIRNAKTNIENYHIKQKQQSWFTTQDDGVVLGQINSPLEKVGVYVPGGTAPLISSVLMSVLPAKIAGVDFVYMATPPNKDGSVNPAILVAAYEAGCRDIYRVGGAQAIAAFAYGTKTVPKVDKIFGPGNIYVATAKRMVYGVVDIDMFAGPSEITILADDSANAKLVAADMLSQAEHDKLAAAVLVTVSDDLANNVVYQLSQQFNKLPRQDIMRKSLSEYGAIIKAESMAEAIKIVNILAPEHLEIQTREPFSLMGKIRHAGAIFLGDYSSESVGDYFAGPNHILPTGGTARFFSPLSVSDFMKKMSVISYTKEALDSTSEDIIRLAKAEGLFAHANAISVRKE